MTAQHCAVSVSDRIWGGAIVCVGGDDYFIFLGNPLTNDTICNDIPVIEAALTTGDVVHDETCMRDLDITVTGTGTTSPAAGSHSYADGSNVVITESPGTGQLFYRYEGNHGLANPYSGGNIIPMTEDRDVTAVFIDDPSDGTTNANHHAGSYKPGCFLPVTIMLDYDETEDITALGFSLNLHNDLAFVAVEGDDKPTIVPAIFSTGMLSFGWVTPPSFEQEGEPEGEVAPVIFTVFIQVPSAATGPQYIEYQVFTRGAGAENRETEQLLVFEEDNTITCIAPPGEGEGEEEGEGEAILIGGDLELRYDIDEALGAGNEGEGEGAEGETEEEREDCYVRKHSGDYSAGRTFTGGDSRITLSELLRIIQFYNTPTGFSCANFGSDGYQPTDAGGTDCAPHSSDYNPQDWEISLSELLRIIQFFNTKCYGAQLDTEGETEDGFNLNCELDFPLGDIAYQSEEFFPGTSGINGATILSSVAAGVDVYVAKRVSEGNYDDIVFIIANPSTDTCPGRILEFHRSGIGTSVESVRRLHIYDNDVGIDLHLPDRNHPHPSIGRSTFCDPANPDLEQQISIRIVDLDSDDENNDFKFDVVFPCEDGSVPVGLVTVENIVD